MGKSITVSEMDMYMSITSVHEYKQVSLYSSSGVVLVLLE